MFSVGLGFVVKMDDGCTADRRAMLRAADDAVFILLGRDAGEDFLYNCQEETLHPPHEILKIGDDMYIKTKRLILRSLAAHDAEALFDIKNDEQVMKHPFFKGDETIEFIRIMISFFQKVNEKGLIIDDQYPERGHLFAICLKDSGDVIGVITVHPLEYHCEVHMGWYLKSQYTKMGYASEAGAAASDYLLEALSLDYITAGVDLDNPASFRTAQKSGFKLFEKRVGYDYGNSDCNVEDFDAVGEYFGRRQNEIGSCCYYFRKFSKNSKTTRRFYGDIE